MAHIVHNKKEMETLIMSTAAILLRRHGIRAVTMDDIANEISISKKTIYQYFDSKISLIDAVVEQYLTQKTADLNKAKYNATNAIEQVFLGWYIVEDFFQLMNNDASDQLKKQSTSAYHAVTNFKTNFLFKHFKSNIETGITQDLYRHNINPDILTKYVMQILSTPVNINTLGKGRLSYIDIEDEMLSYHIHGIATPQGISLVKKYQQQLLAHKAQFE